MTTTLKTLSAADLLASKPAWAVKALVAEYHEDMSDMMTDYFATRTTRTVFLGWSRTTRDSFADMRKAAATFSETAHLATADKTAEHREKYSMGKGYYLKASSGYSTGWLVRKVGLWIFTSSTRETVEVLDTPTPDTVDKATLLTVMTTMAGTPTMALNVEKSGVELRFPSKPSDAVRAGLKTNGWRWSPFNSCWYKKDSPEARAFAESMVKEAA